MVFSVDPPRSYPKPMLTAEELQVALAETADLLHANGINVAVVAVGGAVNTLLLHSRNTTSDVDFFLSTKSETPNLHALLTAIKTVEQSRPERWQDWMNNHTAVFIGVRFFTPIFSC